MNTAPVAIIGAGFTGLSIAYRLVQAGVPVTVLEAEPDIGGLAAAFPVGGQTLDRFYHHWFTNDREVMTLIEELGLSDKVTVNPTNTGIYYAHQFFRLSTPLDLLRFKPLGLLARLRLGLLALRARRVRDWHSLESLTAHEWLRALGGEDVYRVVWQPLIQGKFGPYADEVSAVWFWNKLKLRGGSRGKAGEERLAYFERGFVALAEALARHIVAAGGRIVRNARLTGVRPDGNQWQLETTAGQFRAHEVAATVALPLIADMIDTWAPADYLAGLRRIRYLGNVCMVLELDRSLSDTYWLNVNDPSFPFVGIIEHTNFARPETYGGRHIVYLSKYLPVTDTLFGLDADSFLAYALPYIQTMFPAFRREWVVAHHLWRARWSQPVVERFYSRLIPPTQGPRQGFHVCSMAQIYPEDRGTNYALREGRRLAEAIIACRRTTSHSASFASEVP